MGKLGVVAYFEILRVCGTEASPKNIGTCNVLVANQRGVIEGLKFVYGKNYKKVELQTDNKIIT